MNDSFSNLGRYISIFDRLMKMEYLYDHPGATAQEMAECIRVDKATLTKTIKKLTEVHYVRTAVDEKDRRVRHLYLTEAAVPAAKQIKKIHADFYDTLSRGIFPGELSSTEHTLQQMVDNINQKVWHRMEEHHGEQ